MPPQVARCPGTPVLNLVNRRSPPQKHTTGLQRLLGCVAMHHVVVGVLHWLPSEQRRLPGEDARLSACTAAYPFASRAWAMGAPAWGGRPGERLECKSIRSQTERFQVQVSVRKSVKRPRGRSPRCASSQPDSHCAARRPNRAGGENTDEHDRDKQARRNPSPPVFPGRLAPTPGNFRQMHGSLDEMQGDLGTAP